MSKLPNFGKMIELAVLDNDGSVIATETNYQNGSIRLPRYKYYEYRTRVFNSQEEMAQYLKHCEESVNKLAAGFHKEYTQQGKQEGWYYVVKSWMEPVDE